MPSDAGPVRVVGNTNDEREQTLNHLGELRRFDPAVRTSSSGATIVRTCSIRAVTSRVALTVRSPWAAIEWPPEILKIHVRKLKIPRRSIYETSPARPSDDGADLANICAMRQRSQACAMVARRQPATSTGLDRLRLGVAHPRFDGPEERRIVAFHESGHALVAWLTPGADPVHKYDRAARSALWVTEQLPAIERHT